MLSMCKQNLESFRSFTDDYPMILMTFQVFFPSIKANLLSKDKESCCKFILKFIYLCKAKNT